MAAIQIDPARQRAYRVVLAAALLHVKWDTACWYDSNSWLMPWRWPRLWRSGRIAADRAATFHNLAIFATHEFEGFSEERFWIDVVQFHQRHSDSSRTTYRDMFDRCVRGEQVEIIKSSG